VTSLDWAVVVQKPREDAYRGIYEMQRTGRLLAWLAVFVSVGLSILSARRITSPCKCWRNPAGPLRGAILAARASENPHRDWRAGNDIQHHVGRTGTVRRRPEARRRRKQEPVHGSIQMLAGAVDEKDPYTRGHSDRVTKYSLMIGAEMGLDAEFLEILRISAQLHDVGKIGIEDRILKKPGALTPEEFEIMKTHTTKGANILRPVPQLREMLPGIELHHEALNGRGYPYGLKGDDIPLLARVIAVADTFDALTTNRPYQKAHDPVEALRIIQNLSGQRLDPSAVTALMGFFTGRNSYRENGDADGPCGIARNRTHSHIRSQSHAATVRCPLAVEISRT